MTSSSTESPDSIFVRAGAGQEIDQTGDIQAVSKISALIFTALAMTKLFHSGWAFADLNQLSGKLTLAIGSLAGFLILHWLFKIAFSKLAAYISPSDLEKERRTVRSWRLSPSKIEWHFDGYVQTFSATSVQNVNVDSDGLDLFLKSGEQGRLEESGFASEADFAKAKKLLTEAMNLNESTVAKPEPSEEGELVVSSNLTREHQRALRRVASADPIKSKLLRVRIGTIVACCFVMALLSEDGISALIPTSMPGFALAFAFVMFCWESSNTASEERKLNFRWGISRNRFTFCSFHENSYRMIARRWDQLSKVREVKEGMVLTFKSPTLETLIPKSAVSLTRWSELVARVSPLSRS